MPPSFDTQSDLSIIFAAIDADVEEEAEQTQIGVIDVRALRRITDRNGATDIQHQLLLASIPLTPYTKSKIKPTKIGVSSELALSDIDLEKLVNLEANRMLASKEIGGLELDAIVAANGHSP